MSWTGDHLMMHGHRKRCHRSFCLILFLLIVHSASWCHADTGYVSVARVEGMLEYGVDAGKLQAGEVTFVIHFATPSTNTTRYGIANGWRLYSPDGAVYSAADIDSIPGVLPHFFATGFYLYEWDGPDADSVGVAGLPQPAGGGIPIGYDQDVLRITTTLDASSAGSTICLDSSYCRPGANWEWFGVSDLTPMWPEWSGPHCYEIVDCGPDADGNGIGDACEPPDTVDYTIVEGDVVDLFSSAVFDVDLDNYPDVVFSDPSQNGVFIAYGESSGALETPVELLTVGQSAILIDYINADTLPDIGIATTDTVYILFNHGDRVYSSTAPMLIRGGGSGKSAQADAVVRAVASGYFDDDDFLDLAVAPDEIHIGLGDGGFSTPTILPFQFEAVNVCDFNSDGKDDLVVLSGDQIKIYLNNGGTVPSFTQGSSTTVGLPDLQLPLSHAVTDFDQDGFCDFALVTPLMSPAGQSAVTVVFWERTGGVVRTVSIPIQGVCYELAAADPNRDGDLDIIVANGTAGRLEFFFGDGAGSFSDPQLVPLAPDADLTYVLATLDLNRDGNPDFVSGSSGGGSMQLAFNANLPDSIIQDEAYFPMVITGYSDVNVKVINPAGFVISRNVQTVAGSDYWRVDADGDGHLDEQSVDYNVVPGEYQIIPSMDPSAGPGALLNMSIGIDGHQERTAFLNYDVSGPTKFSNYDLSGLSPDADTGLVFYYAIYPPGQEGPISPPNLAEVRDQQPTFRWDGLAGGSGYKFGFELGTRFDLLSDVLCDVDGLEDSQYKLETVLATDNMYYWRVLFNEDLDPEYESVSRTFAVRIVECCVGTVGNTDLGGEGTPADEEPTLGDIMLMVDAKFVSGDCSVLQCLTEADVNQDGGANPTCDDITLGDIMYLVDYIFITGPGLGLPDCPSTTR
jgi:hypothetical protein